MFAFINIQVFLLTTNCLLEIETNKFKFDFDHSSIGNIKCKSKDFNIHLLFKFFDKPSSHTIDFCIHNSAVINSCCLLAETKINSNYVIKLII